MNYPNVRKELLETLKALSCLSYQKPAWVNNNSPKEIHDNFDYAIHFLYDDNLYAENIEAEIGDTIKDKAEAKYVMDVINTIHLIFDKYGKHLSDQQYIELPEWPNVLMSAAKAYQHLK